MLTSSQNHSANPDGVLMQLNSTPLELFKGISSWNFTMSVVMLMVVCCAVVLPAAPDNISSTTPDGKGSQVKARKGHFKS